MDFLTKIIDFFNPFGWIKWLVTVAFLTVVTVLIYQQPYVDVKEPIGEGLREVKTWSENKGVKIPFLKIKEKKMISWPKVKKGLAIFLDHSMRLLRYLLKKVLDALLSPAIILAALGIGAIILFAPDRVEQLKERFSG